MANLTSINTIVSTILTDAQKKIGEALIERAAIINSMFNDAYGSCLGGHYASSMECAAEGLKHLDDLLDYAYGVMDTADGASWECVRDALGSVVMEKAPLQDAIIAEYNLRIKRYVSPSFGNRPKLYVVKINGKTYEVEDEDPVAFRRFRKDVKLESAEMYTLGAGYDWNSKLDRWVLDSAINPVCRPELQKFMK